VKVLKWVLVAVVVMGVVGIAVAADGADKPKDKPKVLRGTVVKVDGKNVIISTRASRNAEAKEVTVVTDEKTKIVIPDKEGATLADLKADMRVSVTPETGTAEQIKVMPPRKPRGGDAPKEAPK
jgi:hypothetical protein